MVRLKDAVDSTPGKLGAFQFQYGTIKSIPDPIVLQPVKGFQFQYGTIKSSPPGQRFPFPLYFNSNMVRLKVVNRLLRLSAHCISIPIWYD